MSEEQRNEALALALQCLLDRVRNLEARIVRLEEQVTRLLEVLRDDGN